MRIHIAADGHILLGASTSVFIHSSMRYPDPPYSDQLVVYELAA